MKTQAEVLQSSDISTDDINGVEFTPSELDFLAVAEGFAFNEWDRACETLGLCATVDNIPDNYDALLQRAGRWTLDYTSGKKL